MTFEQYYSGNFEKWVKYLSRLINNLEEAEDRVQNIFMQLSTRKEFCGEIINRDKKEFDRYILRTVILQTGQIRREQNRQVPTVSIDNDNIDFLSLIRDTQGDDGTEAELNDFYGAAIKLLENSRKLTLDCGFETVGELRQYIFIQYCRNGRTFEEIGKLVGSTFQNISLHYKRILTILTPFIYSFLWGRFDNSKNDLKKN